MTYYKVVTKRMDIVPADSSEQTIEVSRLSDRLLICTINARHNDESIEIPLSAAAALAEAISVLIEGD